MDGGAHVGTWSPEMSAISRKSQMPLRSCCKTFSERRKVLAAWCTASQAFLSALRSSWKSFSRWQGKRGSVMQGPTAAQRPAWTRAQLSTWLGLDYPIVRRHRSVRASLHRRRPAEHADPRCDDAEIQELPGIGARDDQGTRETQRAPGARARISGAKRCAFSARPVGPDACRSPAWRWWFL